MTWAGCLAGLGSLHVHYQRLLAPGGDQVWPARDGGALEFEPEHILILHGDVEALFLQIVGAAMHSLGVSDVVFDLFEAAVDPGPGLSVVLGLEPRLPLAPVHAYG